MKLKQLYLNNKETMLKYISKNTKDIVKTFKI